VANVHSLPVPGVPSGRRTPTGCPSPPKPNSVNRNRSPCPIALLYASFSVHSRTAPRLRCPTGIRASAWISCGVQMWRAVPLSSSGRSASSASTPIRPLVVRPSSRKSPVWLRLTSTWSRPRG
jgi:hypothetical protein